MDAVSRKPTLFRFNTELLERLKMAARRENRSLNNFVESVLMDIVFHEPNTKTIAAIEEARSGKLRDAKPIDTSSVEAMLKSIEG